MFFLTSLWMKKVGGRQRGQEHVGNFSYFPEGGGGGGGGGGRTPYNDL